MKPRQSTVLAHSHYWDVVGEGGRRWWDGHALACCRYCAAWTVVQFGQMGPCEQVVNQADALLHKEGKSPEVLPSPWAPQVVPTELAQCSTCGAICEDGRCENCD